MRSSCALTSFARDERAREQARRLAQRALQGRIVIFTLLSQWVDSGPTVLVFTGDQVSGVAGDECLDLFFREVKAHRRLFACQAVKQDAMVGEGSNGDRDRRMPEDVLLNLHGKLNVTGVGLIVENAHG